MKDERKREKERERRRRRRQVSERLIEWQNKRDDFDSVSNRGFQLVAIVIKLKVNS